MSDETYRDDRQSIEICVRHRNVHVHAWEQGGDWGPVGGLSVSVAIPLEDAERVLSAALSQVRERLQAEDLCTTFRMVSVYEAEADPDLAFAIWFPVSSVALCRDAKGVVVPANTARGVVDRIRPNGGVKILDFNGDLDSQRIDGEWFGAWELLR